MPSQNVFAPRMEYTGATDKVVSADCVDEKPVLTQGEYRVLALVTQGDSNKEIAAAIGISPATVKRHIENLLKKLNLRNRVEVAVYGAMIEGCSPAPRRSIRASSFGEKADD